jgi:hypothetical protein
MARLEKEQKKLNFFTQAWGDEGLLSELKKQVEARIPKR